MGNLYIIKLINSGSRNLNFLSPIRINAPGWFFWDHERHAFVFDDDTINDPEVQEYIGDTLVEYIRIDDSSNKSKYMNRIYWPRRRNESEL